MAGWRFGIYDLRWANHLASAIGARLTWVHYHVPRATLDGFTDDAEIDSVAYLRCQHGSVDPVLHQMTQMLLPSLAAPQAFSEALPRSFSSSVLRSHHTQRYAPSLGAMKTYRGGLAPWQKRRVAELLQENLDGQIALADLAHECRIFRQPHFRAIVPAIIWNFSTPLSDSSANRKGKIVTF